MNRFKDKSNARIVAELTRLAEVMQEEGRGFIFVPIVQEEGDHKTMAYIAFSTKDGEVDKENIKQFWATLLGLVANAQTQIPEDLLGYYDKGGQAFVKGMAKVCFPQ